MFRKILALTLVITISWTTTWSAAPVFAQTASLKDLTQGQVIERLEMALSLLDQLQSEIDRSLFDLEAVVEKQDFEAERIISFVKNQIRFEPYAGLLRGALGTLMSQAGNSLDQSVLLARLLKDAGYEARIGRARLSADQASQLIEQLFATPFARQGTADELEKMTGAVSDILDQLFVQELSDSSFNLSELLHKSTIEQSEMKKRVARESQFIVAALHEHKRWPREDPAWREKLVQKTTDYFWVQWREGTDPWIGAHPALAVNGEWISTLEPTEIFADTVPESLLHQFEFQVIIEQKIADRFEQRLLLEPWRRPVANLIAKPLQFMNMPNTLASSAAYRDLATSLESATLFIPYFSAQSDAPATPFDRNGNSISLDAITSAATGLFQQFGENTEKAASALRGLGGTLAESPDDLVAISAQWIEFSTISPSGDRKTTRRTVLDRVSPSDRAAGIPRLTSDHPLNDKLVTYAFMLNPGWIPPLFVLDRAIDLARTRVQYSLSVLHSRAGDKAPDLKNLWSSDREDQLQLLETLSNFDQYAEPGTLTFRSEPSLFSIERHLSADARLTVLSDIVWNSRTSFHANAGNPRPSPSETLRLGVAETGLEGASYPWTGPMRRFSAFDFLENSHKINLPFRLIDANNSDSIRTLPLAADRRAELSQDVQDGFTVLVPVSDEFADSDEVAWWRVDVHTGDVVGVGPGQRGIKVTEYLIFTMLFSMIGGAVSMFGCMLVGAWLLPTARAYLDMEKFCGLVYTCAGVAWSVGTATGHSIVTWGGGGPTGWIALAAALGFAGGGAAIAVTGIIMCGED